MGEIISLNRARKARAKALKASEAAANRARFGRTKGERLRDESEAARRAVLIDGAKRDD